MSVKNIVKGVGKTLKTGAKEFSNSKVGKFMDKYVFDEVKNPNRLDDALYYGIYNRKLKKSYVVGGMAVIGGINVASDSRKMMYRNKLGDIEAGGLSHMTSNIVSKHTASLQAGAYDANKIKHSMRNAGAEGDIVFALHNMR